MVLFWENQLKFCAKNTLILKDKISKNVNLNLADLDLKKLKLSEEDAVALSYLTPGLSRRIQKQLLAQLAPSEVRKLHRTLSSRNSSDNNPYNTPKESQIMSNRRSVDRLATTLPKKYLNQNESVDSIEKSEKVSLPKDRNGELVTELKSKSFLPIKFQSKTDQKLSSDNRSMKNDVEETENIVSRSRVNRALSVREPRMYGRTKTDSNVIYSPDSSLSESVASSHRKDSDSVSDISSKAYSTDSYPSISRPPTYLKYSTNPNSSKIYNKTTPILHSVDLAKTDINKPSNPNKRISRFLRPDFFDPPKEDNIYLKEKKEREMETQKVLKEIRDKRKERLSLRRERSASREKQILNVSSLLNSTNEDQFCKSRNPMQLDTPVNNSREEIIPSPKNIHDYVNVTTDKKVMESSELISEGCNQGIPSYVNVEVEKSDAKKVRSSKIARPKSYPAETHTKKIEKAEISPEKESKISRFRKGFVRKGSKEKSKDDKNETNKSINEEDKVHKNKLLQSIEKKLEKFRFSNNNIVDGQDIKVKESGVENVIKRLREQSLPRNLEHCTESGLIKRAVSVEDLSSFQEHSRPLQASRKSVTKILGLFKKYEDADSKNEKVGKKKKVKDNKTDIQKKNKKDVNIITTENSSSSSEKKNMYNGTLPAISRDDSITSEKKIVRPRSFLFDKVKHFQNVYNGAKSDSTIVSNEANIKTSKLPVNTFRRSLNLETALPEPPKLLLTQDSESSKCPTNLEKSDYEKPNRQNLTLDFSKIPNYNSDSKISPVCPPCTSSATAKESNVKRYSLATTDDSSSAFVSPCDDVSCDSWSNCSDYHTNDLSSPITPNEHVFSGDENESVIDRIRRKSFYTRFNEKKKPRKNSFIRSYRDLDLYKDLALPTSHDYGSLDRRTYDYTNSDKRRSPLVSEEKVSRPHTKCASVLNDYVNVPNRYESYTSKIARPTTILCSDLVDDTLDDVLLAAKSRKYSSLVPPSPLNRKSPSPARDRFPERSTSTNTNGITYPEPA